MIYKIFVSLASIVFCFGCGNKINSKEDKVYSRHLQKQMELVIVSTPVPNEKSDFNLLILNDGQDFQSLRVQETLDSLWKVKSIKPLVIVGVKATNRDDIYGVAGMSDYEGKGKSAEKYGNFIKNELLPYVKKMSGVRKFNSVIFAGNSLGGLSAFDIVWDNWQKFDKVGVFSGSFGVSDLDPHDPDYSMDKNRLIISKITSSRKKPKLKFWFYAGAGNDSNTNLSIKRNTKDLIELIKKKKVAHPNDIDYAEFSGGKDDVNSWSRAFPAFLIWAVGK
ncbi:MAG: alpha/beta hydrolase-fold protein [Ginsengibacter sp.]